MSSLTTWPRLEGFGDVYSIRQKGEASIFFTPNTFGICLHTASSSCRSHWPRRLKRGSATARLLSFWICLPPVTWVFVSFECCVLSGRGLWVGLITSPEESYRVRCVQWVRSRNPVTRDHNQESVRNVTGGEVGGDIPITFEVRTWKFTCTSFLFVFNRLISEIL
jgi:hypothetical protein